MSETIGVYEVEDRTFPPPEAFAAQANTNDRSLYEEAEADYEAFWARQARELVTCRRTSTPFWSGICRSPVVRGRRAQHHLQLPRPPHRGRQRRQVAYHWEGEPGDQIAITYAELLAEVNKFANVLKGLGLAKGDRAAIYMPMILGVADRHAGLRPHRGGHSVIFGGFSADAIVDRCEDAEAKIIIPADAGVSPG